MSEHDESSVQFVRVSDGTAIRVTNPALVQLKRSLAGMSLGEQQEAVRPGGAVQLSEGPDGGSALDEPVQFAKPGKGAVSGITSSSVAKRPKDGLKSGERAGGFPFGNKEKRLPEKDKGNNPITYTEYDVNTYDGKQRDAERVVVGSDGRMWYTGDHYGSFDEIA